MRVGHAGTPELIILQMINYTFVLLFDFKRVETINQ